MAKKKKAKSKKKRPVSPVAGEEAVTEEPSGEELEASGEEEPEGADEDGDEGEAIAEEEAAAAAAAAPAPKAKIRGRGKRGAPVDPEHNPNIPSPEGPRVSSKGGLVFVAIIIALMGLAIGLQFVIG